jgi:hypothetical protein
MTDIETLRSNVINAARACRDHWNDPSPVGIAFEEDLMDAVDALDAADAFMYRQRKTAERRRDGAG